MEYNINNCNHWDYWCDFSKKFHYHIKNVTTLLHEKMKIDKNELKKYSVFKMIDGLKDNFKSKLKLLNIYQKDEMYKENILIQEAKDIIKEYFSKYMFNYSIQATK